MTARRVVIISLTGLLLQAAGLRAAEPVPGLTLTVGEIEIRTGDIFSPGEVKNSAGAMRFLRHSMNALHFNTRHHVIRRELLFRSGEPFNSERLAETERNLRDLGYLNNVRVTAVDTTADGRVNVLVATREAWTLRTSFSYARASSGEQRWNVQASDGNFLGHGVTAGAGVGADEDTSFWNLWYRQRRLTKAGFWLGLDYSQRKDGHMRQLIFNRPFYALDDPWGTEFRVWSSEYNQRFYLSNGGQAGLDPTRPDRLYGLLAYRELGLQARVQLRASAPEQGRIWRLGGGVDISDQSHREDLGQVELSDGRVADLSWLAAAGEPYAREQGVEVRPFLWAQSQGRRWAKSRFLFQYGPIEDVPLDLFVDLRTGPAGGAVGSTTGYGEPRWHSSLTARRWFTAGGGLMVAEFEASNDLGSREVQTYKYRGVVGWMRAAGAETSPWLTRIFAEYAQARNLLGSEALLLGLDRGVRTLDFDGMAGDRLVRWNIEQGKALPWEIGGLVRAGVAVFYDGGSAWWGDEVRGADGFRNEVGFGVRFGPTRSANAQIARIDLAWDLNGSGSPVLTAATRGLF